MEAEDKNTSGETCWTGLRTSRLPLLFSDIPAPAWLAILVTQHSYTQSETCRSGDGRLEDLSPGASRRTTSVCSGRVFRVWRCLESWSARIRLGVCAALLSHLKVSMQMVFAPRFNFNHWINWYVLDRVFNILQSQLCCPHFQPFHRIALAVRLDYSLV